MIKVEVRVKVYERGGKEIESIPAPEIKVESHWNRSEMVVLTVGAETVTVVASDLRAAIVSATNTR